MNTDIQKAIREAAEREAWLQFNPQFSKDENTACKICFEAGANFILNNPELMREEIEKVFSWFWENKEAGVRFANDYLESIKK